MFLELTGTLHLLRLSLFLYIDASYEYDQYALRNNVDIQGDVISLDYFYKFYFKTMFKILSYKSVILLISLFVSSLVSAQTQYVTDQFEVTLRSGSSTSNSIISMMKSGEKVKVIEQDPVTKYTMVETSKGKTGYILTRFLDDQASGRDRFNKLKTESETLKSTIKSLKQEVDESNRIKNNDTNEISILSSKLNQTENELHDLKAATHDTLLVIQQNDSLKTRINELETDKQQLVEENISYKDSTAMDWFIRGASVSLIAFLLGIIVTRIRWKKRDSWSNY